MNPIISITLVLQGILCLVMSILGVYFQDSANPSHKYLYGVGEVGVYSLPIYGILNYFTYFLLLNTLIPISLIISLEFVKLF